MTSNTSSDLKQVSELFRDLISIVRARATHDLDDAAQEWLKYARISILKKIEKKYHELSVNATHTLSVPYWAVNPSIPLCFFTPYHPRILDPYSGVFLREIRKLMDDCGFVAKVEKVSDDQNTYYSLNIHFATEHSCKTSLCDAADAFERLKLHQRFTLHITEDTSEVESISTNSKDN